MLISILALIVCLVGLLMYALSANAKIVRIGEIMFACGLLVTLFLSGGHTVKLF